MTTPWWWPADLDPGTWERVLEPDVPEGVFHRLAVEGAPYGETALWAADGSNCRRRAWVLRYVRWNPGGVPGSRSRLWFAQRIPAGYQAQPPTVPLVADQES